MTSPLSSKKHVIAAGIALWLLPLASWAQNSTTEPVAPQSPALPCMERFQSLDADGNQALSEAEAPAALARARVEGMTLGENGLSHDDYTRLCENANWQNNAPEEGAPFEGANSFTENQARDRVLAWEFTDVSPLAKDDKGIWRGTAKQAGADVDIAVDYKGNVVATPK